MAAIDSGGCSSIVFILTYCSLGMYFQNANFSLAKREHLMECVRKYVKDCREEIRNLMLKMKKAVFVV